MNPLHFMELAIIDWVIIGSFLLLSLLIGIRYKNKASGGLAAFFLGGRNLPWYIAGISMVATTFAADTPLAVTEFVADSGISKNWLWWSFLIGGMLTTFFFARLWRRAEVITELELIEFRYSGRPARLLRGFKAIYLGIFMNCMIIAWVNLAMITLILTFFPVSYSQALLITGGAMIIAMIYSSLSGLLGVAITDTFQFFIAIIACTILAILVLNSEEVGGIDGLKSALHEDYFKMLPSFGSSEESGSGISTFALSIGAFFSYVAVQWWASWYPGAEPGGGGYIAQRFMSTRNEKDAVYSTLFFQIAHYCLRPWPWIIVALCAIMLYSNDVQHHMDGHPELIKAIAEAKEEGYKIHDAADKYPVIAQALTGENQDLAKTVRFHYDTRTGYTMVMQDFLPPGLLGLLLVAFLAAYLSTISTHLNWGASYLVNDLYKRNTRPENTFPDQASADRHYVFVSRVFTVIIMIIGLVVTTQIESIGAIWEFVLNCGAGLGMVLILRWYWWRINAWSEITATLAPFIGYALSKVYLEPNNPAFAEQNGTFLVTVGFTTISWIVVTFLTAPTNFETLKAFYRKVKPDGSWGPVRQQLELPKKSFSQGNLVMCWLSGITMVYGVLFFTGKIIFKEWQAAMAWGAIMLVSFAVFQYFLGKTDLIGAKKQNGSPSEKDDPSG